MPTNPLGPTGLLAQSMTLPAGSQSLAMGGMGVRAQGMDGRKKAAGLAGQYLIVGGGGASVISTATGAGGGGGGGVRAGSVSLIPGSYAVVVGAKGTASANDAAIPTNGGNSSLAGIIALGGGAGGALLSPNGKDGGCGGGSYSSGNVAGVAAPGQGFDGNVGNSGNGGGAGGPVVGNNGGPFLSSSITGASVNYGGGGRGANRGVSATSAYGTGGGGNAGVDDSQPGVVIWSYASPTQLCTGGTVTNYTSGGIRYWVHTFTSNGTLVVP